MAIFDRFFLILFARSRRALGDSQVATAWQVAMAKLGGYLVFPVIALTALVMLLKHLFIDPRGSLVDKNPGQLIGVIIFVAIYAVLYIRYRTYSSRPPTLTATESTDEETYFSRFRIALVGLFVAMLLISICVGLTRT